MKRLLNERGQLTLDFLFASILLFCTTVLVGVMCFALTLSEIVQYVAFSASRAYFAGDLTKNQQQAKGANKAQILLKRIPFLSGAVGNGWITVTPAFPGYTPDYMGFQASGGYAEKIGAPADDNPNQKVAINRDQFDGMQLILTIPLLNVHLPLIGEFKLSDDKTGIRVSSFLMREPATDECMKYMSGVYEALLRNSSGKTPPGGAEAGRYVPIMDNGC